MTPLGHASIGFLVGIGATKIFPSLDRNTILAATTIGSVALDFDLFYRFYQKGTKVFDKTIGQHRFFPSHTPLFALILSTPAMLLNFTFGLFLFLGMLIHLCVDTLFFPEGINFLYPVNRKMYTFLTVKTHSFWAPEKISGTNHWAKNYLLSPIFWIAEVLPFSIAIVVLCLR